MGYVFLALLCLPWIGAALFAPLIYSAIDLVYPEFPWPFARVYSRVATLVLILLIACFRKELRLAQLKSYFAVKRAGIRGIAGTVLLGIALSTIGSALFIPLVLQFGMVEWVSKPVSQVLFKSLRVLPTALLIAAIEESFFRVIVLSWFRERTTTVKAAILVSLIYAGLHFISPVKDFTFSAVSISTGFAYTAAVFQRVFNPALWPALVGLFLVGLTLSYAVIKTRSIYLSLGLHAGWIIAVKVFGYSTALKAGQQFSAGIAQRYYLVSTWLGWLSIIAVFAALGILWETWWRKSSYCNPPLELSQV